MRNEAYEAENKELQVKNCQVQQQTAKYCHRVKLLEGEILDKENSLLTCNNNLVKLKQGNLALQEAMSYKENQLEKYR